MGFEGLFGSMAKEARHKGTVKWFHNTEGYGFISPDDGSDQVFLHRSSIVNTDGFRSLFPGDVVEFQVSLGDDGRPKAVDVTGPNRSPIQPPSASRYDGHDRSSVQAPSASPYDGRACYNCGQTGHRSRDCMH